MNEATVTYNTTCGIYVTIRRNSDGEEYTRGFDYEDEAEEWVDALVMSGQIEITEEVYS